MSDSLNAELVNECFCFACTSDMTDWFPSKEFQDEYIELGKRIEAEKRRIIVTDLVDIRQELEGR